MRVFKIKSITWILLIFPLGGGVLINFLISMTEHVDEGAQRGEEPITIQTMVMSTTRLGKNIVMIFVLIKHYYE
jgi:hypothetical protein